MKYIAPFTTYLSTAFLLILCGCSDSSKEAIVQGTVTIDGVLATRGQVTFHPDSDGAIATGPIHNDGSFSLRIGQGNMAKPDESKIPPGEYTATVVVNEPADKSETVGEGGPPLAGKRLTAVKFARKETSGLKYKVKEGRNVIAIDVEGSQNDPPLEEDQSEAEEASETDAAEEKKDEPTSQLDASDASEVKDGEAASESPDAAAAKEEQP